MLGELMLNKQHNSNFSQKKQQKNKEIKSLKIFRIKLTRGGLMYSCLVKQSPIILTGQYLLQQIQVCRNMYTLHAQVKSGLWTRRNEE